MNRLLKQALGSFLVLSLVVASPAVWAAKEPKTAGKKIVQIDWTKGLKMGPSKKGYFPEGASPIVHDGKILVGTHSGFFYALDGAHRGRTLWQFRSNGPIASQPLADGDKVFFGNNKGTVACLEISSGKMIWDAYVGGEVLTRPTLLGDTLYVVTTSREVYALEAETGAEKWATYVRGFERKLTMRGHSPVVAGGERLYVGFADGLVASLSRGNGEIVWQQDLSQGDVPAEDIDASVIVDGPHLYVVGYFGHLVKMERDGGSVIWRKEVKSGTDMVMDDSNLYLTTVTGEVVAFDKNSALRRWETPLQSGILSSPLKLDSSLLVGTESNCAYVLDSARGELLQKIPVSSGYIAPAVAHDRTAYFLSSSAKLYAVRVR